MMHGRARHLTPFLLVTIMMTSQQKRYRKMLYIHFHSLTFLPSPKPSLQWLLRQFTEESSAHLHGNNTTYFCLNWLGWSCIVHLHANDLCFHLSNSVHWRYQIKQETKNLIFYISMYLRANIYFYRNMSYYTINILLHLYPTHPLRNTWYLPPLCILTITLWGSK